MRVAKMADNARKVPCTEGYVEYVIDGAVEVIENILLP